MNGVFYSIAAAMLTYLAAAFVLWELNPANWTEQARFFVVWLGGGLAGAAFAFRKGIA